MESSVGVLSLIVMVLGVSESAKFPKNWKNCKHDEKLNDCLKDALQDVIPSLVKGVPSLGILTVDPLHFERVSIGRGTGPVSLDLDFVDFDVTGIKNFKIDSVETDWKVMKFEGSAPKVHLTGKYKADGRVMVLPVKGEGDCSLEMDNFKAHAVMRLSEKVNGGKTYYHIEKIELDFDVDHLKLHFDNLFNGDKRLGTEFNVFINENWKELLAELRPPVATSFALAFTEIGNRVFTKIPKNLITPP